MIGRFIHIIEIVCETVRMLLICLHKLPSYIICKTKVKVVSNTYTLQQQTVIKIINGVNLFIFVSCKLQYTTYYFFCQISKIQRIQSTIYVIKCYSYRTRNTRRTGENKIHFSTQVQWFTALFYWNLIIYRNPAGPRFKGLCGNDDYHHHIQYSAKC